MANMAMALIKNRRIRTTLAKAKALRPFIEKVITLAKKAHATDDKLKKQHFHSLALSRVRDLGSVNRLFNDLVEDFTNRAGGYTRIYKLVPRRGDAADMAIIELIAADDEGYGKRKAKSKKSAKAESPADETSDAAESSTEDTYQRIPLIPNLQLKNPRLAKATVLKIRKLHLTLKIVQTPLSLKIQTRPSPRKLLHLRKTIAPKSNSILFLCSPPVLNLNWIYFICTCGSLVF